MKKLFVLIVLATIFLVLMGNVLQAQTAVTQWGSTPRGTNGWTILNTASTPAGNASMGGTTAPTGWMSIKGGFDPITPTTSQAFVITGTFEFVGGGGGSAYTWLRYALFNEDGTLTGQNTPTAAWSETSNAYGYEFDPRSGAGTIANGSGGGVGEQGTEWYIVNSKSWTSTNSNGGRAISTIVQAPYNQVATAGVYDWAISVQPRAAGGSEVRWYFVQQHAANSTNYYWWGGSFIDPTPVSTKFNSIGFACNNDVDATMRQVNLANVKVSLGSPITVPEAPFQPIYVGAWGSTGRGNAWPILNDSTTYVIGDAAMGSTAAPTGWATILGSFGHDVSPTSTKAVVITGTFEFVGGGGGSAYTWLRYALFHQDSLVLANQYKPTAAWTGKNCWGYEFDPRSGAGTISNGSGGGVGEQGTAWYVVNSGAWTSTNSNGGRAISTVLQAPYNQVATAGVYDWAISVQPLATGGSEVRYYFIQQHAASSTNYYWWGGSFVDPTPVSTQFNAIGFGVNNDVDATCKQVNIRNVKVDLASPITVPAAPWQAYYVKDWGFIGGRMYGWTFTQGDLIGNATMSGTAPNQKWAAIRGGFEAVSPTTAKALVLTGNVEFVGGGYTAPGSFRLGTFYSDQAGKVILDTAKNTLPDSTRWDGVETYTSGYLFVPPSGANGTMTWAGLSQPATSGGVINGAWLHNDYPATGWTTNYTLGTEVQTPANAAITAGVYDFTISVYAKSATSNDVRWKLSKGTSYSITGKLTDTHAPLAATKFNSINFAVSGNAASTGLKVTNVKVDYVDVASVPIASAAVGVTDVEKTGTTVPTEFALSQNYPNPFNPSTTIRYDVAKLSHVRISVYDVLGRNIATLVDGMQTPSQYVIHWSPAGQSSGTYFYRIDASSQDGTGNFSAVKKLVYMK
jgi:hypothetical protein